MYRSLRWMIDYPSINTCKAAGSLLANLPEYFLKYSSFAQLFYHGGSGAYVKDHITWKMTETDIFFSYSSSIFSSGTRGDFMNQINALWDTQWSWNNVKKGTKRPLQKSMVNAFRFGFGMIF